MIRILPVIFILILTAIAVDAQHSKTDFLLAQKIRDNKNPSNHKKQEEVKVLVKGDIQLINSIAVANGGKLNYSSGDIASIRIPLDKIHFLLQNPSVQRIEMGSGKSHPLNDTASVKNNVTAIHSGQLPLPQAYDGTGVVIGFMDTGIDYSHPDLQDSTGKSRIKYLWDQNKSIATNTPQPYNYGQEWTNTEIDAGAASAHNDLAYYGHGTHAAGIAAGNGLALDKYKGIAPNSDIIMVAMDFNYNNPQPNADAVNYIFEKAQSMGKPCVINASVGNWLGSHDGQDLEAQLIDNLIKAQNGRAMVASVGNYGDIPFHLGYDVTPDSSFTWFKHNPSFSAPPFITSGGGIYIQTWADTNDFKNVELSIGVDKVTPTYSFRGMLPYSNIADHLDVLVTDTLKNSNNRIGIIYSYGQVVGNTYSMEYLIKPDSTAYFWRLITKGSGRFDCWAWSFPDMISGGLPTAGTFPDIARYKLPDTDQTMVSSFQCLPSVITVGNYYNKKSYYDYNNNLYTDTIAISNDIVANSSRGPTRQGLIKPDISATGDNVISCSVLSLIPSWITNKPYKVAPGSMHIADGGTSASSPVVAGIAALYLQKNPNASYLEIKDAIIGTAKQDGFTGSNLPDNIWGHGKLNGFSALTDYASLTISDHGSKLICAGDTSEVSYMATNANNAGNILTVELSDSSGNFSSPVIIGTGNGSNSGTISCVIPLTILSGSGYLIRLHSSNPEATIAGGGNITIYTLPSASISGDLSACSGNPVLLTANSTANYYLWSTQETDQTISASTSGTYSLTVTDNNNCSNSTSVSVSINNTPTLTVAGDFTICKGESTIITVSGSNTYGWNPVSDLNAFATDSAIVELSPDSTRAYLISTSLNGCDTAIALTLVIDPCLQISEPSYNQRISVYPNPFYDQVFLQYDLSFVIDFTDARIELYNALGERIATVSLTERKNIVPLLNNTAGGIYFYRLLVQNKTLVAGKISSINN